MLGNNNRLVPIPVADPAAFVDNLRPAWLGGNTLALDFAFPAYRQNTGHWTEALIPALRVLQDHNWSLHCKGSGPPVIGEALLVMATLRRHWHR